MALSQILDDSPLRFAPKQPGADALLLQELYNERHRLALEELLSGGVGDFLEFLGRERIPNFLSDEEIQRIRAAVVPPPGGPSLLGEEPGPEQSLAGSLDCSSVTYFPEVSDVEPPLLEIGWPAFTAGSYRGVTRAVAHFQPSYGESIYSCKEAARRLVKSAREVIAIVTDSLTDLDIFKDLQEACSHRRVPVYILLDQSSAPAFLKMCRSVGVRLDDLQQMRVRTITGTSYYMRSGARITGKVHERFMLIDGNRVATGSYRFNWTDGKLNSSNLIELSGQITEKFDEEFRVLYAQSLPINTRGPPSVRGSGVFDHLVFKHPAASSPLPVRDGQVRPACLTSTPSRKPQTPARETSCQGQGQGKAGPASGDSPAVDGDWTEQPEEILAGCSPLRFPPEQQAETEPVTTAPAVRHVSTQTGPPVTDPQPAPDASPSSASPEPAPPTQRAPDSTLKDSFHKLTKERLHRYSAIRSKLEHMVTALTERRELADISNVTQGLGVGSRQRIHKDRVREPNPRLPVESVGTGTWPRARCAN